MQCAAKRAKLVRIMTVVAETHMGHTRPVASKRMLRPARRNYPAHVTQTLSVRLRLRVVCVVCLEILCSHGTQTEEAAKGQPSATRILRIRLRVVFVVCWYAECSHGAKSPRRTKQRKSGRFRHKPSASASIIVHWLASNIARCVIPFFGCRTGANSTWKVHQHQTCFGHHLCIGLNIHRQHKNACKTALSLSPND